MKEEGLDLKTEELIYAACLEAALELGDRIKGLSWFGRNAKSARWYGSQSRRRN